MTVPKAAPKSRRKAEPPKKSDGLKRAAAKARNRQSMDAPKPYSFPIKPPELLAGVVPVNVSAPVMAMDSPAYVAAMRHFPGGGFPGYAYLSQLATRAEFRAFASALSTELTREWLEFTSKQDDDTDSAEKIKKIEAEFKRLNVRGVMQKAAEHDCYFGRAQIYIDIAGADRGMPLILDPRTVKIGSLQRVVPVEPIWTTPSAYNALDPSSPDFYTPSKWFMLGQEVHASRLMTIVTRPLPDILKPAFNFGGMSLSQLAEPYVDNWLRTRQSVSDLLNNFSITALATSMDQVLQGEDDGSDLFDRADLFTATRSNRGLMLIDKEREELVQVNTPLSGLHELQAQSQEHMCSVSRTPAIILTGISPSGLNASSDGEIRIFYDWVSAQQEAYWREPVETILKAVQLSLFGEIDPDIGVTFIPLYQMTPKEESDIRLQDSQTAVAYIGAGVIDPSEERERLARDPNSGYQGLDTGVEIVPPVEPTDEAEPWAMDADFDENKHPRVENGKFGSGGSGASQSKVDVASYHKDNPGSSFQEFATWLNKQGVSGEQAKETKRAYTELVKGEKESKQAQERAVNEKAHNELAAKRVADLPNQGVARAMSKDQIDAIAQYIKSGDRHGAQAEGRFQTVNSIENELKSQGVEIEHVSESQGGASKSLYVKVGEEIVRVSDHELPITAKREDDRARGLTGKWDREVVVGEWQTTSLDDYIKQIKGE